MVIIVPWEKNTSQDKIKFVEKNQKLWYNLMSDYSASSYEATRVLIAAIKAQLKLNQKPTRKGMQKVLKDKSFRAEGVRGDGSIEFADNGDRKPYPLTEIKIIPSACSPYQFNFVSLQFNSDPACSNSVVNPNK